MENYQDARGVLLFCDSIQHADVEGKLFYCKLITHYMYNIVRLICLIATGLEDRSSEECSGKST